MIAALVVHFRDKGFLGGASIGKSKKNHTRVASADDDEDDEDEDGEEDFEGQGEDGDENDPDEDEDGEKEDTDAASAARPESMKAFVALGDQIHSIVLPLTGIDSWAELSQTIHETCEESGVPDLPVHGIMHIVLNVDGKTVPVTGMTPLDELWKAKAIKVSITDEDADTKVATSGKSKGKKGKKKGKH